MGLVGVVVTDGEPGQPRLAQVGRHPVHDLADIGVQRQPVAMFGGYDEPEMMTIVPPRAGQPGGLGDRAVAVEDLRAGAVDARP